MDALVLRKFKKPILCFEIEISSFCSLFFLCFFHVHYFLFTLLTIIGATKQKSAHINNVPDINKIITITLWQKQDMTTYSNFRKIIELGVIQESRVPLITYKIHLALFRYLYSHKNSNFYEVMLTDLIGCNYLLQNN